MPSSDDQSVDMPTNADPVRQREPDPIVAQLRERMERLPHGHPSSPYNDDGSRKPPLPDLSKYEIPIPGDPDYRSEPWRPSEAYHPESAQTSDHMTPGTNAHEDPERTADSPRLWKPRPDAEPLTEARKRLDQERAPGLATNEESTLDARDGVPQDKREALHDAPADDLNERAADEPSVSGDLDYQPEPSRASEAEGSKTAQTSEDATPATNPGEDPERTADRAQLDEFPPDVEPLTDAEYTKHVQEVRERLDQARAQGLATNEEYTLDVGDEVWQEEREVLHDALVDELYERATNVPAEQVAIIAGGLPGAGKSTVLERYAGIDRSRFLIIDPDEIKEAMARRDLIPSVEGLSPMEASDLVHEESSYIAKRLARRAQAEGKNVIWDITMSSRASTEQRIEALRTSGYTHIEGIFVDIPLSTSEARAEARHRIGHEEYRAGKGQGGRLIPADLIGFSGDLEWGSVNRRAFEEVKRRLDAWSLYENSTDGKAPKLIGSSETEETQL